MRKVRNKQGAKERKTETEEKGKQKEGQRRWVKKHRTNINTRSEENKVKRGNGGKKKGTREKRGEKYRKNMKEENAIK